MSRKILFETMIKIHEEFTEQGNVDLNAMYDMNHLNAALATKETPKIDSQILSPGIEPVQGDIKFSEEDKAHRLWSIVHETAFARTFTEIAEELNKIIAYSKFILGEEIVY